MLPFKYEGLLRRYRLYIYTRAHTSNDLKNTISYGDLTTRYLTKTRPQNASIPRVRRSYSIQISLKKLGAPQDNSESTYRRRALLPLWCVILATAGVGVRVLYVGQKKMS